MLTFMSSQILYGIKYQFQRNHSPTHVKTLVNIYYVMFITKIPPCILLQALWIE